MTQLEYEDIQKGDSLYFARTMPKFGYYEIHNVVVVTKQDDFCTVCETKTKQSFIFNLKSMSQSLYINRDEALDYLKEEKNRNKNIKVYSKTKEESTESEE